MIIAVLYRRSQTEMYYKKISESNDCSTLRVSDVDRNYNGQADLDIISVYRLENAKKCPFTITFHDTHSGASPKAEIYVIAQL